MLVDTISLELYAHTEDWRRNGQMFLHEDFWMLRLFDIRNREFLFSSQPYRMQENRVVWVRKGRASYSFNLVDYVFEEGDLVVFYADTLVEKKWHSPDFQFDAFRYEPEQLEDERVRSNGQASFIRLRLDEDSQRVVSQHFDLMWQLVHQKPFPVDNVRLLTRSLLLYANRKHAPQSAKPVVNRRDDVLRRFVSLVSQYAGRERNIPFYADRLCMAPHYLSTFVKQSSGRTVMQWINHTAVKEGKVWLAYSDETAAQISERLYFPCPASLTKFFKRETGMTPGQYRHSIGRG